MLRTCFRSSRPKVFLKIDVHKNFAKFRGKHLRGSFFFINVTDLRLVILLEKRLQHKCFPVLQNVPEHFFIKHLRWLLLMFSVFSQLLECSLHKSPIRILFSIEYFSLVLKIFNRPSKILIATFKK